MFNEEQKETRTPDFSSYKGISVWTNQDKNGDTYMTVSIPLLNIRVNCFKLGGKKEE